MILSKNNLSTIRSPLVQVPPGSLFALPEKILQFGTGVLLRGLPDYFIDKANRKGIFNGRIIVVKSTDGGEGANFEKQDYLYTICVRGQENNMLVEENWINASISRVLSAKTQWDTILQCAHLPQFKAIISNTTEVGIQLVNEKIDQNPPLSFPAKLLSFLVERFKAFKGSTGSGMVIIPTELIVDNGIKLKSIILELAHFNDLAQPCIEWIEKYNYFCNSLVDRIVPGKPAPEEKMQLETLLGYRDELIIKTELYRLWAIEGDEAIQTILSFAQVDAGVIITPDIRKFRELKLRLLNGTHTISCGLAFLSGFETVFDAMENKWMSDCIQSIMIDEIAKAIPITIETKDVADFGANVLDRFRNNAIRHQWISITLQYTSKLRMRVVPVLKQYYTLYNQPPPLITTGFAAWLLFMRSIKKEDNQYFGKCQDQWYPVKDDYAELMYNYWQSNPTGAQLPIILGNESIWGIDLAKLPEFSNAVYEKLKQMMDIGVAKSIQSMVQHKENA